MWEAGIFGKNVREEGVYRKNKREEGVFPKNEREERIQYYHFDQSALFESYKVGLLTT